jgi:hypothetical protein
MTTPTSSTPSPRRVDLVMTGIMLVVMGALCLAAIMGLYQVFRWWSPGGAPSVALGPSQATASTPSGHERSITEIQAFMEATRRSAPPSPSSSTAPSIGQVIAYRLRGSSMTTQMFTEQSGEAIITALRAGVGRDALVLIRQRSVQTVFPLADIQSFTIRAVTDEADVIGLGFPGVIEVLAPQQAPQSP